MKSFGAYISKCLASFAAGILILLLLNAAIFNAAFYQTVTEDYGNTSPRAMLDMTASAAASDADPDTLSEEVKQKLREQNIWAMYLNSDGRCVWSFDLPEEVPQSYTIQETAVFSRGYIKDYPVFIRTVDDGLFILGYPKDSYTKLISNYYSIPALKKLPWLIAGMLGLDIIGLFFACYGSRRRIIRSTEPIAAAAEALADGKPVSIHVSGELAEIADSVNKASRILSRQNEARANWISGVSHDIRTPLSMIMGYAERIAEDENANASIREQAGIVQNQSIKIKELVQDLNLVSQLEYGMQPLPAEPVRLSKLIRSCAAELLNAGISDAYTVVVEIADDAENSVLNGDARLLSRAISNLVQNSIRHNPGGCEIRLALERAENLFQTGTCLVLSVTDNGAGISAEKQKELEEKTHYMESLDKRLDLRHGLGLLIVRQIVTAHKGIMQMEPVVPHGCRVMLTFPIRD